MSKKQDEIIFGARRAGVTWLYSFEDRADLEAARAGAQRLGLSLSQLLCEPHAQEEKSSHRKFIYEDRESHGLKIQITECNEFTQRALERQAAYHGTTVEEYIIDAAMSALESFEETSFLDPQTGGVMLDGCELGTYIGCNVQKGAPNPPPSNFTQIPIPRGAIVEGC